MEADRKTRRSAAIKQRKFRRKVERHSCVMDALAKSECVAVELTEAEHHRLHVAHGEEWCQACQACKRLRDSGRQSTRLKDHEVAQLKAHWARKVYEARHRAQCDHAEALASQAARC